MRGVRYIRRLATGVSEFATSKSPPPCIFKVVGKDILVKVDMFLMVVLKRMIFIDGLIL